MFFICSLCESGMERTMLWGLCRVDEGYKPAIYLFPSPCCTTNDDDDNDDVCSVLVVDDERSVLEMDTKSHHTVQHPGDHIIIIAIFSPHWKRILMNCNRCWRPHLTWSLSQFTISLCQLTSEMVKQTRPTSLFPLSFPVWSCTATWEPAANLATTPTFRNRSTSTLISCHRHQSPHWGTTISAKLEMPEPGF